MRNLLTHPYKVGTNQHQIKRKYRFVRDLYTYIFFVMVLIVIGVAIRKDEEVKYTKIISPVVKVAEAHQPTEKEQIMAYIKEVFGKDANKAFKLLTCENSSFNPNAINTAGNFPAGSKDMGVFQVNEYWQGVNPRFLKNWKVNVQIAHQIYVESGNNFKMWTCGRRLGI